MTPRTAQPGLSHDVVGPRRCGNEPADLADRPAFADRSQRITVVTPGPGAVPDRCRTMGFDVVELPFPAALNTFGESGATAHRRGSANRARLAATALRAGIALPGYLRSLRAVMRRVNATVVHSNGLKAHVAAALAKPAGTRLVWHLHEYLSSRPLTATLLRRLRGGGRGRHQLRQRSARCGGRHRIPHDPAANPQRRRSRIFSPEGPPLDLAALSGLAPDGGLVRIGLVSTFARWKATKCSSTRLPGCGLDVPFVPTSLAARSTKPPAASGRLRSSRQWSGGGISDIVGFTGHVDDVPAALRSLDIVVHASTEPEPFGMVIAEGMAARRAVVAARAGGAAELFRDRVDAIGFTPGNAAELADRLEELVVDATRRETIAASARSTAIDRFSPERMARAFREAYAG